jgi:hypothetical protein
MPRIVWLFVVLAAAMPLGAQNLIQLPAAATPNRLGLSYRMAFNIEVSFKTQFNPALLQAGPGISGVDRNYDDGYNRVDNTGNEDGITHYWGYESDSQYDAALHTITLHGASGSTEAGSRDDGLQMGVELTYNRELGRRGKARWGVESAINYLKVSIRDNQPAGVGGTLVTDTYQLPELPFGGGYVIPPPAPYHGTHEPPASGLATLSDSPSSRATSALNATSSGTRDFDANVIGWRIGPYLEFPVVTNLSFSLSGGFSLVGVISDYRYNETVTYHDPGSALDNLEVAMEGSGTHSGLLAGGFVGGGFYLALEKGWTAFGGVQFQYAGTYTHGEGASSAKLDLGKSLFVSLGASYSF